MILSNTDPSLVVGKRKEIVNVMRKARDNPNDYWDKKLLEVEERGLFIFTFSKLGFFNNFLKQIPEDGVTVASRSCMWKVKVQVDRQVDRLVRVKG